MAEFVIAYIGKKEMSKDQGMKHREQWMGWLSGLGDAVVNPGTPLSQNKVIGADGKAVDVSDDQVLTGFTVVQADDLDAALAMAKNCPYVGTMGHVQVAQVMKMG